MEGRFPPQKKKSILAPLVFLNFVQAHKKAYKAIHDFNNQAKVGTAQNYSFIDAYNKKSLLNKIAVKLFDFFSNRFFLKFINHRLDFIGVNYYFHNRIKIAPLSFPFIKIENENKEVSDMGWEIYPEGIYHVLRDLKKYNLPIYITENGIADKEDKKRAGFIKEHLKWTHRAITEGVDVRGYMYWSMFDNFEWDSGFAKRFGLIEMDYEKMEVKIRESAREYAEICKENAIFTVIAKNEVER